MITRQDIIDMANEVELDDCIWIDEPDSKHIDDLVKFAELVAAHTLSNIDPSKFMSFQEGYQAGLDTATQGFCDRLRQLHDSYSCASTPQAIRERT